MIPKKFVTFLVFMLIANSVYVNVNFWSHMQGRDMVRLPDATSPPNLTLLEEEPKTQNKVPEVPDLCVVITFPPAHDELKMIAHNNTARMYRSFLPRVQAFQTEPVPPEAAGWDMKILEEPETNQHGTPFFMSLMQRVEEACPSTPLLAYANADILFDARLIQNIDALLEWNQPRMMAVGRRNNHELEGEINIDSIMSIKSEPFINIAQDYFIMTCDLVQELRTLPTYVIGRRAYDNALVDWAFHNHNLVDLSQTLTALHQTTSDGNYAGHSAKNTDKEFNVQLPDAQYDHGSMEHAQFVTSFLDEKVVVTRKSDKTVVSPVPKKRMNLTSRGRPVSLDDLPSPLLVTFGNSGYKEILANFLCNTAIFPPMHAHTLIIVTDLATLEYLSRLDTDVTFWFYEDTIQGSHDYDTPDYIRMMLLRGQLLLELLGNRVVMWLEADAQYFENILKHPQIATTTTDLVMYWDGTMYGGGFIRFAATQEAKQFYAEVMSHMKTAISLDEFKNDQIILNEVITTSNVTREGFDRCQFRSGLYYHFKTSQEYQLECTGTRPVVQQHNWVIGTGKKIALAKEHDAWFLHEESPLPVCSQRDVRAVVMTMDRPASLERLLVSLKNARYKPGTHVDIQVSVDKRAGQEHDAKTLEILRKFEWPHGFFEVLLWPEPVGIYGQWVDSWPCELYPANLYTSVILLEDDLEVSPVYHEWFTGAHQAYASKDIGAVTGMRAQLVAKEGSTMSVDQLVPSGVQVFAYRLIATWSMSPTYDAWKGFRAWVKNIRANDPEFDPTIEGIIPSQWYRMFRAAGTESGMWEIWLLRYMHDHNLYTIHPWIEDGAKTVVCNWKEQGLHFSGLDSGIDYPLIQEVPAGILALSFVPYVEWGMAFYMCLTHELYGQTSNQILTISWAQKKAKKKKKFLRLSSISTPIPERYYLVNHWSELFDDNAIPFLLRDSTDDERCSSHMSFEETYSEMMSNRARGLVLPMPRPELLAKVETSDRTLVSVHGRSLDGACDKYAFFCVQNANESKVQDMCDYSQHRVRKLFHIDNAMNITLFTDGQDRGMMSTYELIDQRPFFEQLWAMILSPMHIGNPKSSMDFMISIWRKQIGIKTGMEPAACYDIAPLPNTIQSQANEKVKWAIATLITNSVDKSMDANTITYTHQAVLMAKQLHERYADIPMLAIATVNQVQPREVSMLESAGYNILWRESIKPAFFRDDGSIPNIYKDQFMKFLLWKETEYDIIVYLDSDTFFTDVNAIDFESFFSHVHEESVVACPTPWSKAQTKGQIKEPITWNGGFFILKPSLEKYDVLMTSQEFPTHFSTNYGPQKAWFDNSEMGTFMRDFPKFYTPTPLWQYCADQHVCCETEYCDSQFDMPKRKGIMVHGMKPDGLITQGQEMTDIFNHQRLDVFKEWGYDPECMLREFYNPLIQLNIQHNIIFS